MVSRAFLVLAALAASFQPFAYSACLPPLPIRVRHLSIPVLFYGRVVEITPQQRFSSLVTHPDGTQSTVTVFAPEASVDAIHLTVLEAFQGSLNGDVTVMGAQGQYQIGREYLVVAMPDTRTGQLDAGICSGTMPLTDPDTATTVSWLRAYPTAPPTAEIYGTVTMAYGVKNIPAIALTLTGPVTRTGTTADGNRYFFKDLPPGTYTLTGVLPPGYTTGINTPRTVTVPAKGVALLSWFLQPDTHLTGTVTDAGGKPVPRIPVGLFQIQRGSRFGFNIVKTVQTDANGNYDFAHINSGGYLVAIYPFSPSQQDPHVRIFYPNAARFEDAKTIQIPDMGVVANIDLVSAPELHPLKISVQVTHKDGTPVSNADVLAVEPRSAIGFSAKADASGHAQIALYEGREYRLVAYEHSYDNANPACGGPIHFTAQSDKVSPTLILDTTFHVCRAEQNKN